MDLPDLDADAVESTSQLDLFLRLAAMRIQGEEDPKAFMQWAQDSSIFLLGVLDKLAGGESDRRGVMFHLGRAIWQRTPVIDLNFRPRKAIPAPERNAPCPCGSGRKYKQCCAAYESMPEVFEGYCFLDPVLSSIATSELAKLPIRHAPADELAWVCHSWAQQGEDKRIEKLLDPLFADVDKLDERHEGAFDELMDAYTRLHRPLKKKRLIERMRAAPDRVLRSSACQRLATMLADQDDHDGAWSCFLEAQRHDPENLSLCVLEVTLLQARGDQELARERSRFWIARLEKLRQPEISDLIETLRQLANDPKSVHMEVLLAGNPALKVLHEAISALPVQPEVHHRLEKTDLGWRLEPDEALAAVERSQSGDDDLFDAETTEIAHQQEGVPDPLLWHSFDFLGSLISGITENYGYELSVDEILIRPLFQYADRLLCGLMQAFGAEEGPLPWGFVENRAALQLQADYAGFCLAKGDEALALALHERCVLKLNPTDNQGLRNALVALHLKRGDAVSALDVADRYPNDFPSMEYLRVLALYMAGRVDEAGTHLQKIHVQYPLILKTLLAEKPRKPKLDAYGYTLGGADEAWYFREDYRDLWQRAGALNWANSIAGSKGKTGARKR